jgi:nitrogen-specific signal transduction histidine kinase
MNQKKKAVSRKGRKGNLESISRRGEGSAKVTEKQTNKKARSFFSQSSRRTQRKTLSIKDPGTVSLIAFLENKEKKQCFLGIFAALRENAVALVLSLLFSVNSAPLRKQAVDLALFSWRSLRALRETSLNSFCIYS